MRAGLASQRCPPCQAAARPQRAGGVNEPVSHLGWSAARPAIHTHTHTHTPASRPASLVQHARNATNSTTVANIRCSPSIHPSGTIDRLAVSDATSRWSSASNSSSGGAVMRGRHLFTNESLLLQWTYPEASRSDHFRIHIPVVQTIYLHIQKLVLQTIFVSTYQSFRPFICISKS